ncbi:MAG: ribosome maturation factor RimP [Polyangiaceae bacterium]|nr:ribosome maturation factor RimP [Polyangiaceae bacterium]
MPHVSSSKSPSFADLERLSGVIAPVARAHGAEIWDIELKNESGWVLRVYVERLGAAEKKLSTKDAAIDLELCAALARDLSHTLDVEDPIPCHYNLEVSSPGIERPLKSEADYVRFAGEKAKLKLRSAVEGQKVFTGRLGPVSGGTVMLEEGDKSVAVSLDDVTSARLVFDFGPAPKPGATKDLYRRRRTKV